VERLKAWLRRRWLLVVIAIAFLVYILLQINNLTAIARALTRGNYFWVGAAALVQVAYYVLLAYVYELGFAAVGVASNTRELLPVLLASRVVQAAIPSGGVAGLAVFIDDARRRGQSAARATEGTLLVLLAVLVGALPVIFAGVGYLYYRGVLVAYFVAGTIAFFVFTALIAGLVFLGRVRPLALHTLFRWLAMVTNAILRRLRQPPLPPDWSERQATSYVEAAADILREPRRLRFLLLWSFVLELVNVATLFILAIAYNAPPSLGAALAAAAGDAVFSIVSPLPLGLGVVAGVIAVVLSSLGVPGGAASAISLVYRGLNIYLPLAIGFLFLRQLRTFGGQRY